MGELRATEQRAAKAKGELKKIEQSNSEKYNPKKVASYRF